MIIRKKQNKKRKQNREKMSLAEFFKRIFFWTIFLGFWLLALWTLVFSEAMKVETIIVDSSRADKEEVKTIVYSQIEGNYLGVIPRSNLLIVPDDKIKEAIKEKFIFVKEIRTEKRFPKTIEIELAERDSHIIWCSKPFCSLIDENAEAFYVVEDLLGDSIKNLVVVNDISGKEISIGGRVADPAFIDFCEHLPESMGRQTEIEIEREISTPSSMSEEVRVTTKDGWQILFSTSRGIDTQIEIIKKLLREKIPEDKLSQLEYLDLRIKGKATFRFKEESKGEEENGITEDNGGEFLEKEL